MLLGGFGCRLEQGVALVLEFAEVADRLRGADLVVTGEGRLDSQTRLGKAPQGIFLLARQMKIPIVALSGSLNFDVNGKKKSLAGVALSAVAEPQSLAEALRSGPDSILSAAVRLGGILKAGQQFASGT